MAGFQVDPRGPVITMAKEKRLIIMELRRLAEGDTFSSKAIEGGSSARRQLVR